MNPFELTATPFLQLYAGLYLICLLAGLVLRRPNDSEPALVAASGLNPVEVAYLAAGPARAADAAIIGLMDREAAVLDVARRRIDIGPRQTSLPGYLVPFRARLTGAVSAAAVTRLFRPALEGVRASLAVRGLALDPATATQIAFRSAVPMLLLSGFGLIRILLGLGRGRPVGFIVLMTGFALLTAFFFALRRPVRTRAGGEALRELREDNARLMRAPRESEVALAVALAGTAVLTGTPYTAYAQWRGASGGGDSSGGGCSGGGDGGGGGCGGCSS